MSELAVEVTDAEKVDAKAPPSDATAPTVPGSPAVAVVGLVTESDEEDAEADEYRRSSSVADEVAGSVSVDPEDGYPDEAPAQLPSSSEQSVCSSNGGSSSSGGGEPAGDMAAHLEARAAAARAQGEHDLADQLQDTLDQLRVMEGKPPRPFYGGGGGGDDGSRKRRMAPAAISFVDVTIKGTFTSSKRLVTLQLDELKLLQQLSATATKSNNVAEIDVDSFERPKGGRDGLVTFKLTTTEETRGDCDHDDEPDRDALTGMPARLPSVVPLSHAAPSTSSSARPSSSPPRPAGGAPAKPRATMFGSMMNRVGLGSGSSVGKDGSFLSSSSSSASTDAPSSSALALDAYTRTKHFQFRSPEEADTFVDCCCLAKAHGGLLRAAFQALDKNGNGVVEAHELLAAAEAAGFALEGGDAAAMIGLGDVASRGAIDFSGFFAVFLERHGSGSSGHVAAARLAAPAAAVADSSVAPWKPFADSAPAATTSASPADALATVLRRWLEVAKAAGPSSPSSAGVRSVRAAHRRGGGSGSGGEDAASAVAHGPSAKALRLLLPGEEVVKVMDRARWRGESMGDRELFGTLRVTTYRLLFSRYEPLSAQVTAGRRSSMTESAAPQGLGPGVPGAFQTVCLPLGTIARVEFSQRLGQQPEAKLSCKDTRFVRVALEGGRGAVEQLVATLKALAFPGGGPRHTFAFRLDRSALGGPNGWEVFQPTEEYARIGFLDGGGGDDWRLLQQDFRGIAELEAAATAAASSAASAASGASPAEQAKANAVAAAAKEAAAKARASLVSPTYPEAFVVPKGLSDDQVRAAAGHRSKCRLPAATWMDRATGAVLARSSQPMSGMGGKRSGEDVLLLEHLRVANGRGSPGDGGGGASAGGSGLALGAFPLYIADCRGFAAVAGNKLQGKGAENAGNYTNAHLCFCDILNIHTMRDSQAKLAALLLPDPASQAAGNSSVEVVLKPTEAAGDRKFIEKLDECGWLRHVSLVLSASVWIARRLRFEGASVLVHCSDGWDRTAQVCATAQLLLDSHYRTIEGFGVLVEKEWLSFGHKFQERTAHAVDETGRGATERSPIFVQWLEAVSHIVAFAPGAFEFTENFLVFVADGLYSCLFGTFLGNTDRERKVELNVAGRTASIWSYALASRERFANPHFSPYGGPLWPSAALRDLGIWRRYYLRHHPEAHPHPLSGRDWADDYGEPVEPVAKC